VQTQRDQVQAHLFVVGRLNAGILRADPDAPQTPLSRTGRGVVIGLVLAVLATAAVAVYGLLKPASDRWRDGRSIVLVEETGARYLYLSRVLHPLLNYASAALLLGVGETGTVPVENVPADALHGVPRGAAIGVPGAPDDIPAPAELPARATWQVCGTGSGTRLAAGTGPTGPLIADTTGVVASAGGTRYLLWRGHRYVLPAGRAQLAALGYDPVPPRRVGAAFLAAVPPGPDLTAVGVRDRGAAGPRLAGAASRVGQLFTLAGGGHYLLRTDGLVPVTETMFDLLRADSATVRGGYGGGAVQVRTIQPGELARHRGNARHPLGTGLPSVPPEPVRAEPGQAVCLVAAATATGAPRYGLRLVDERALPRQRVYRQPNVTPACHPADHVAGPPGGELVRALPASGNAAGGARYLVTAAGIRYRVDGAGLDALGYARRAPIRLPQPILALLPSGPDLSPASLSTVDSPGARDCR